MPGLLDVNPNSRAPFVDSDGRLTKYGMDVMRKIYVALGISGDTSNLDELFNRLVALQMSGEDEIQVSSKSADFSTLGEGVEIYEITAACTVTLSTPSDENLVVIYHNAGYATVSVTDGSTTDYLLTPKIVMPYQYFTATGWVP